MAEIAEQYVAALAIFGQQVQDVADHEWDLPTPCVDWDVRQIVAHVVLGEAQLTDLLRGEAGAMAEIDASIVGVSPMSVWRGTALAAIEASRAAGIDQRSYEHAAGTLSSTQLLSWRISENLVHAHDLSVAVGRPKPIDNELAEASLTFWWPLALELGESSEYGAATEPPADATAGERLLFLLGRG